MIFLIEEDDGKETLCSQLYVIVVLWNPCALDPSNKIFLLGQTPIKFPIKAFSFHISIFLRIDSDWIWITGIV